MIMLRMRRRSPIPPVMLIAIFIPQTDKLSTVKIADRRIPIMKYFNVIPPCILYTFAGPLCFN